MTLSDFFTQYPRVAVAFSGGADSAFLLWAAKRYGAAVGAYYVKTPFQPAFERSDARRLAEALAVPLTVVEVDVLSVPEAAANGPERCYHCKKALFSAREAVFCRPAMARLYPTVILEGTDLSRQYKEGLYRPFSQEEMLRATKDMYRILAGAGIQIIRVGLKSSDLVRNDGQGVLGNSFHPAFRQLVEGELAKEDLEEQLLSLLSRRKTQAPSLCPSSPSSFSPLSDSSGKAGGKKQIGRVRFLCHPRSFSNMLGNKGRNRAYFQNRYPFLTFRFQTDSSMKPGLYRALME